MPNGTTLNSDYRIVLTGGPGAGKTTAADLIRREYHELVEVVPEAATLLFAGGFPRATVPHAQKYLQRAIYHVQRNLESAMAHEHQQKILLCDRGTIDSAIYWPSGPSDFFSELGTTLEDELGRYKHVIFFETGAAGKNPITSGNPYRKESDIEAVKLDKKLQELWSRHPNYTFIPNTPSFLDKLNRALACLKYLVKRNHNGHTT